MNQKENDMTAKVIAVKDIPADQAGAIVYWSRSGSVDARSLDIEWTNRGLDPALLPSLPSPEAALRRAVLDQTGVIDRGSRRRREARLKTGGFALYDVLDYGKRKGTDADRELAPEEAERAAADLRFTVLVRAKIGEGGELQLDAHPDLKTDADIDRAQGLIGRIHEAYFAISEKLSPEDMSDFTVRMLSRQQALSLRNSGGIYFVPRAMLGDWKLMSAAIVAASENRYKLYEIPALISEEAAQALFDAITTEAEAEASELEKELSAHYADEANALGKRALDTRLNRLLAMREKVSTYEELLGKQLTTIADRLESVRAGITQAKAAIDAAEEAA